MNSEDLARAFVNAYRTEQPATPEWEYISVKNKRGVIAGVKAILAKIEAEHAACATAT